MKYGLFLTFIAISMIFMSTFAGFAQNASRGSGVVINDVELDSYIVAQLQQATRTVIPRGSYWYDPNCGAWGKAGGPTLGFTYAGLNIGGSLKASASNGRTKVFIN